MVLVPPPPLNALRTKISPFLCRPSKPPVAFGVTEFWKNQKPILELPLLLGRSPPKTRMS
jgi:hypothetical protein